MEALKEKQAPIVQNLVAKVSELLANNNHPQPDGWRGNIPDDLSHLTEPQQRAIINRQLRLVIGNCESNTAAVRFCLIDDGQTNDWVRLIDDTVAPFMAKLNLVY